MTLVAFLRHGPTEWSAIHRIQGRTDIPLSAEGRAAVGAWRLPPELESFATVSSPLRRAVETAKLLRANANANAGEPTIEPRLAEMDWGEWEGRRLDDLRRELGRAMAANEARGFDFRPEGGESPRDLLGRLLPWLAELGAAGRPTLAVTHKGVIRALLAEAAGWDMTGKPPVRLDWSSAHVFAVDRRGGLRLDRANLSLAAP